MTLRIIKLAISSNQRITTSPTVTRLFHVVTEKIHSLTTHKINTSEFMDDSGNPAELLPELRMNNNYFNVFINGSLQMDELFAYTAGEEGVGSLIISVPENSEIPKGSPIILEIVNFYPRIKTNIGT
ncbi:DUF4183 domain-containing protein [Filibacter tadaridae]|uniref:DUF4183 domain-containing protein n=1 Tax=Filibacter tadaridae TaxID=2483811 RepID=A0A3P5X381_9BACL|nr:DUF4183 domain-containing protein [Filibacter tadaridae]VDC28896.1 hypothetical protein FILTAD_01891 [Filibacter tadaridae]